MNRLRRYGLAFSLLGFLGVPGFAKLPLIPARFGEPVRFDRGILEYPEFTVHYRVRTEKCRTDSPVPWLIHRFEVLHRGHLTIGGDIRFTSERQANVRRCDVNGKIYAVEMFSTTARMGPDSSGHAALPEGEIVVWDEAAATAHNPRLLSVWADRKIDPQGSSRNAYADGVLLPGFEETDRLESDNGQFVRHRMALIYPNEPPPMTPAIKGNYGERVGFTAATLIYPHVIVRFVARSINNPLDPSLSQSLVHFHLYDPTTREFVRYLNCDVTNFINGYGFEVGGKGMVAELNHTTAIPAVSPRRPAALPQGELVLWDEPTAAAGNPRIAGLWQRESIRGVLGRYASGTQVMGYTSTTLLPMAPTPVAQLESPPVARDVEPIAYPDELKGSGFVGRVNGYVLLKEDGRVSEVIGTTGNEGRFREPVVNSLRRWRFTAPLKANQAVVALVAFSVRVAEGAAPELIWQE